MIVSIPATLRSAATDMGSSILVTSPLWLPRPAWLLLVASLNSLVSLCEPGGGWLSGFRACSLRVATTACSGKGRDRQPEEEVGETVGAQPRYSGG